MRIYLDQIGCRLNFSEIETLAARLRAAGHRTVSAVEDAQIIVFNSCAVTTEAERKSRGRVRRLGRLNPSARFAVTGCWATLQPAAAAELPGVALVVENERKDLLHTLLEPWSSELDSPDSLARLQPDGTPFELPATAGSFEGRKSRTRAFVKVQDGCDNRCTFCIVTVARGAGRSRPADAVVEEIQTLCAEGVHEVVLTGVHLGSYGRDLIDAACDLKQLTEHVLSETGIARLRLSSLEPWELADGFFDLWQRWPQRLCSHLHVPLQAGTDKQLRHMARRCTTDGFRRLVEEARSAIDDVVLTTDIIVGFPGETDEDFAKTLKYVETMRFAHAHIFPFSARPGTAAASFADPVSHEVKKARSRQMHALVARTGAVERRPLFGHHAPGALGARERNVGRRGPDRHSYPALVRSHG